MHLKQAKSYNETNCMQRKEAEDSLNDYASKIKWLPDGRDSVLHVGSRSGDVLFDYVFPLLPKNFKHIVGIDKSDAMISYATENYRHPKLYFEQADIVNRRDIDKLLSKFGQFGHIISLCSLHWVVDQELAFKSIFDLLAPNGDILITVCQHHPLYEHYRDKMALEKWCNYRQQMLESTSPYFGSSDPVKMLTEILVKAGFVDIHVEMKDRQFHFEKQVFIDSTTPTAPFLCHVPESLRRVFLSTYENKVMTMSQKIDTTQNDRIIVPYRMLTAYAKKPHYTNIHHIGNTTQTHGVHKSDEVRMHNAKKYHETNCMQRKDALDTIMEYQHIFQWTPKGDDYLLDIGAGSGDVTHDYILPVMPPRSQIIASDKSHEMIEYASRNFMHPRITYEKLDILNENDVNEVLKKFGQVNHVTSFCCLHWAPDQYAVMENIFELLKPGGDVLITICQHHPMYEHYAAMSELPKWSAYRAPMKISTTPYFRNENPEKELFLRLERAGFVGINVVLKRRLFHYDSQVFIDSTVPVAPFLDNVSESLKAEFLQIYIDKVMSMDLPAPHKPNKERNDGITIIPFRMLVAYARKPTIEATHF